MLFNSKKQENILLAGENPNCMRLLLLHHHHHLLAGCSCFSFVFQMCAGVCVGDFGPVFPVQCTKLKELNARNFSQTPHRHAIDNARASHRTSILVCIAIQKKQVHIEYIHAPNNHCDGNSPPEANTNIHTHTVFIRYIAPQFPWFLPPFNCLHTPSFNDHLIA